MALKKDGAQALFVHTNTEPIQGHDLARTVSREYRLWLVRNFGGGYRSYFEGEPES